MRNVISMAMASVLLAGCGATDPNGDSQAEGVSTGNVTLTDDSFVSTYSPTMVRGAMTYLKVGASSSVTQRTYLKFSVTGIPSGASNIKATLALHAQTTSTDAIEAHVAKSTSFAEGTLVASNEPGEQTAVLSKVAGTTAGQIASFDVSGAVTGNGTVALALSVPSGATAQFASKESGTATAPSLAVTYDPPVALSTQFGSAFNPHNTTRANQLVSEWGGLQVIRSYGQAATQFESSYQSMDESYKATSNYSFKYLPLEVMAGKHDTEIKSFFQGIDDNHRVYWTYWHEPDDEIYKNHTFTAPDYRAAWAHIRSIADGVKATRPKLDIKATFIFMEYSLTPAVAASRPLLGANGMYPGDNVIEVFGVDVYNSTAQKGGIADAATQFGPIIDFAQQHGKPWGIGEFGSCPVQGNANGRATYLTNAIKYWKSRNAAPLFAAYFDLNWPVCDYTLDNDAAASKVWKQAMATGYASF